MPKRNRTGKTVGPTRTAANVAAKQSRNAKRHLELVRRLPCAATGAEPPNDPHHLKDQSCDPPSMGRRAPDSEVIPLCRAVHDEAHAKAHPDAWLAESYGISPADIADALWRRTGDVDAMHKAMRPWSPVAAKSLPLDQEET